MKRPFPFRKLPWSTLPLIAITILPSVALAQKSSTHNPTWWDKYQYIASNGPTSGGAPTSSVSLGRMSIFRTNADLRAKLSLR